MENNQNITPVIDIHNLDHSFGQGELRKQVLFDINLEINRGEIVLMTGPSGSGKTTLLTLVSGLRSHNQEVAKYWERNFAERVRQSWYKLDVTTAISFRHTIYTIV